MTGIFMISGVVLIFTTFLCLYRVVVGLGASNRLLAVNVIGTKTTSRGLQGGCPTPVQRSSSRPSR